ncbi:ScyD/ScyE family protein [Lacipirellula limnantheis]|uniref:NHL repeat protein n=1 Tax=Lacipirellula limnantheis TaxID=2528024 RepID=A0A517TYX5_9BACT|nr:ScyD/ScyE family protein [Lacipirellula limnantheis]QDT73576.1 NHL repeat protein [Lacipirellula limnantheis]
MSRYLTALRLAMAVAVSSAALASRHAAAAVYSISEVMHDLASPRGLALGPDGGIYVAEAGSGGSGPSVVLGNGNTAFLGATSSLSRLLGGVQERVLTDLPSIATAAGLDASGLQDVAFDGLGQAYGLFSFGSESSQRDANLGTAGANLGRIVRLPLSGGGVEPIADLASHEGLTNPAGGATDSNPFGVAIASNGDFLVADAGGNSFLKASPAGAVSTLGVLPARPNPLPFGPPVFQSVPTTIAVGPDGAYYIGQLTGFPFPPGAANVYRFDPTTNVLSVAHTGFTNIIDLTFDEVGNLFVLQITTNGLASATGPGPGALFKIDGVTGDRTLIASEGLLFPGSVLAGPDGALYVSNRTNAPTGGQVLRLTPVPEPSSVGILWTLLLMGSASARRLKTKGTLQCRRT